MTGPALIPRDRRDLADRRPALFVHRQVGPKGIDGYDDLGAPIQMADTACGRRLVTACVTLNDDKVNCPLCRDRMPAS